MLLALACAPRLEEGTYEFDLVEFDGEEVDEGDVVQVEACNIVTDASRADADVRWTDAGTLEMRRVDAEAWVDFGFVGGSLYTAQEAFEPVTLGACAIDVTEDTTVRVMSTTAFRAVVSTSLTRDDGTCEDFDLPCDYAQTWDADLD